MMNATTSAAQAAHDLELITNALQAAHIDLELLERLKSAADRVKRLTSEQEKTKALHGRSLVAEAKAAKLRSFASISDVRVTDNTPEQTAIRSTFTVHWTKPTWDGYSTTPMPQSVGGLGVCPPDVLEYLIERCPDRIPAKIIAFAPNCPREAVERYFLSVQRGYFAS